MAARTKAPVWISKAARALYVNHVGLVCVLGAVIGVGCVLSKAA